MTKEVKWVNNFEGDVCVISMSVMFANVLQLTFLSNFFSTFSTFSAVYSLSSYKIHVNGTTSDNYRREGDLKEKKMFN